MEQPLVRDAQVRAYNHARLADRSTVLTLRLYGSEARQITVGELAQLPMKECVEIWKVSAACKHKAVMQLPAAFKSCTRGWQPCRA